jgi:hypothetical protein
VSTNDSVKDAISLLLSLLDQVSIDYNQESVAQRQIGDHLDRLGVEYYKEYRLSCGGIIDFYFPKSKLGLEVKASKSWSKKSVFRQCERYLLNAAISGLVLATGRAQGMPSEIAGKPVVVYQLSRGSL